jgi:AcrR family transcriptional regulator
MASASRPSARRAALLDQLVHEFLAEGFLSFTVEDLANRLNCSKSTLYAIAPSKEQLIVAVVRAFFRRATERVEQRVSRESVPLLRIGVYLRAISDQLSPASPSFFADLEAFAPAREIYSQNTAIAARRVQELVQAAAPARRRVNATFIGAVVAQVMESIHRGQIRTLASLDDSRAYRALADLITAGVAGRSEGAAD